MKDELQEEARKLLQWLEDYILHGKCKEKLLNEMKSFFEVCEEHGFKVQEKKRNLFLRSAKFCGRISFTDGIIFDPRHFDALVNMKKPQKGDEHQQLL